MDQINNWAICCLEEGLVDDCVSLTDLFHSFHLWCQTNNRKSVNIRGFSSLFFKVTAQLGYRCSYLKKVKSDKLINCIRLNENVSACPRVSVIKSNITKSDEVCSTEPVINFLFHPEKGVGHSNEAYCPESVSPLLGEQSGLSGVSDQFINYPEMENETYCSESASPPLAEQSDLSGVSENHHLDNPFMKYPDMENDSGSEANSSFSDSNYLNDFCLEEHDKGHSSDHSSECYVGVRSPLITVGGCDDFDMFSLSDSSIENEGTDTGLDKSKNSALHSFFKNARVKTKVSKILDIPKEPKFDFRKEEKENKYFNPKVFSQHFTSMKCITASNLPCHFLSLEEYLENLFPLDSEDIWHRCKSFITSTEMKTKAFLCASFLPIKIGSKSASFLGLPEAINFPQFTLADSKRIFVQCESCVVYNSWKENRGIQARSPLRLVGFRQVYEHYTSKNHILSIKWLQENNLPVLCSPREEDVPAQRPITSFLNVIRSKSKTQCFYVWDKEIVSSFKNDSGIRRKQPKTIFAEKKLSRNCSKLPGHKECHVFKNWKKRHVDDYKNLCQESSTSSQSVFVPGKSCIFHQGKSLTIEGGIKSLNPMCLGSSSTVGPNPYTCANCARQIPILKNLIEKRKGSKCEGMGTRIGVRGFRNDFANIDERRTYLDALIADNKLIRKDFYHLKKSILSQKTWENKLVQSLELQNDQKLIIDLMSLLKDADQSIQIEVIRNLVGKLKSGRNHKYTTMLKDIASIHKNRLGPSNYSLLKSLFGLPSKVTCDNHSKKGKIIPGFNIKQVEEACEIYNRRPVIECTDEARTLRFLSPFDDGHKVRLVGECWNPDIDEWEDSIPSLSDLKECPDQYSALKTYIDDVIEKGKLAKDTAVHNFSCMVGPERKPLVYMLWPTPNKGYKAVHLLKIWDHVRRHCFLDSQGNIRDKPVMLLGHSSDSAGFQLAAARALVTPNAALLRLGVKYLSLGVGESKFAAPYLSMLPAIAYLDYDHEIRLFLKCLKYETLDLTFWPGNCFAGICHLRELQKVLLENKLNIPFLESDLLFARYMDQNCDAALRVFTSEVADLLEEHVVGSNGTVLYIKAVNLLMSAFRNPSGNPNEMQSNLSAGITIFRMWERICRHKNSLRLNSGPGAATNPQRRGNFITTGCYKTAEILFSAATNHMLAMFAHFNELGPASASPFASGTKTTERIISEIQGKTNQVQSLDAQPTFSDILGKVSKVNFNQQAEEKVILAGATKESTTSRKKLAHELKNLITNSEYSYPPNYEIFRSQQVDAYFCGVKQGKRLFSDYCPQGKSYLQEISQWDENHSIADVLKKNLFNGSLNDGYGKWVLSDIKSSDYLVSTKSEDKCDIDSEEEMSCYENSDNEDLDSMSDSLENIENKDDKTFSLCKKWYITRLSKNETLTQMHIRTALKILIPREYVSRERRHRHIACNYLPGLTPLDPDHNIAQFDYSILKLSGGIQIGKIVSLFVDGKAVISANSDASNGYFRAVLLEQVGVYDFQIGSPVRVTKILQFSHIICKTNMMVQEGVMSITSEDQENYERVSKQESCYKDFQIAKSLQKSFVPVEYDEVEDIIKRKIDPKTHGFKYEVKFLNSSETMWIAAENFLNEVSFHSKRNKVILDKSKKFYAVKETSSMTKAKRKKNNEKSEVLKRVSSALKRFQAEPDSPIKKRPNTAWLTDIEISEATSLIKQKFPSVSGFQDTLLSASFQSVGIGGMQIHHNGEDHWLFSMDYDDSVFVYDSLSPALNIAFCNQLLKCYSHRIVNGSLEVKYPKRQLQEGSSDCGVFAIAYATEATCNLKQFSYFFVFQQSEMRRHLHMCTSNKEMSIFPKQETQFGMFLKPQRFIISSSTGEAREVGFKY